MIAVLECVMVKTWKDKTLLMFSKCTTIGAVTFSCWCSMFIVFFYFCDCFFFLLQVIVVSSFFLTLTSKLSVVFPLFCWARFLFYFQSFHMIHLRMMSFYLVFDWHIILFITLFFSIFLFFLFFSLSLSSFCPVSPLKIFSQ